MLIAKKSLFAGASGFLINNTEQKWKHLSAFKNILNFQQLFLALLT